MEVHLGLLSLRTKLCVLAGGGLDAVFFGFGLSGVRSFLPVVRHRLHTGLPTFALRRL